MKLDPDQIQTGNASYAPEDNKLRLYVGRVPRPEFDALRAEGWTCTPKQSCDFVATWTPERRDTALAYGNGVIEDEDQPMAERAADRAERFGGYRDKRTDEATGHADRYDAGPQAHGYQSQARAERAAARHDRIADRSCDAWSKAEYWQQRTAGVISHALYKSRPDVRMGRIKEIESHLRKIVKSREEYTAKHNFWREVAAMDNAEKQNALALRMAYVEHGDYTHPRTGRKSYLYDHGKCEEGRNTDALTGAFDAVVMNPPFHMRSDIKHIQHARTFLKPGAALIALCLDTPHREKALRPLAATWEQVEAGTFSKEGTNVPTVLMSIRR